MSKGINPLVQTSYIVTNVKHEVTSVQLDYTTPILTWIVDKDTAKGMKSFSVDQFKDYLNTYTAPKDKGLSSGILKGLYSNYYNGKDCHTPAPFLFVDIDVKNKIVDGKLKKENVHLLPPNEPDNIRIFEELEKLAVITWRSHSGDGMAAMLYVPQIAQYTHDTRKQHLKVGESITKYLSNLLHEITGIDKIKFDQAQSKFRQVRYVATQNPTRQLNPTPFLFKYDAELKVKENSKGVILYAPNYKNGYKNKNSNIFEQFNTDTQILPLITQFAFEKIDSKSSGKIRVKHPFSSSYNKNSSCGEVDTNLNVYFNYSSSIVNGKTSLNPCDILQYFKFNGSKSALASYLKQLGYKDKQVTTAQISQQSEALKRVINANNNEDVSKLIYSHCAPLQNMTNEQKYNFLANTCTSPAHEKYFTTYLKLADYTIKYDKKIIIKQYVSEALTDILCYADEHGKICVKSDTGNGKTYAFVNVFAELHPTKKILILAPLTMIVDQNKKKYEKQGGDRYAFLTGSNKEIKSMFQHEKVKDAYIVFATYEQGSKWLKHLNNYAFDYVVVDETHQLITANSFKRDVIEVLTPLLNKSTIIGLTGSPSQLFKQLGYKLLDIDVEKPIKSKGIIRKSNLKPYNIALNHFTQYPRPKGKVLMRINSIATINAVIEQLVLLGIYKRSEILFLYSTNEIKNSKDYTDLAYDMRFSDRYKVIFTTALIDEGISILQDGFSDVVFIEKDYSPRPEPIKQFSARFRIDDPNRTFYLYLREKKKQEPTNFDPEMFFTSDLHELQNEADNQDVATDVLNTYNHMFSNNNYYYDNGTVNQYYLAYAVTKVLYERMNNAQFIEYLERNYNLSFTIDKTYEIQKIKAPTNAAKDLKILIADVWTNQHPALLQILRTHSQDIKIRFSIHATMTNTDEIYEFAVKNIKEFEKLYKRTHTLLKLGIEKPNDILINSDAAPVTLESKNFYTKAVNFYTLLNSLKNPITPIDHKSNNNFIKFKDWCIKQGKFSNIQMKNKLEGYGVKNHKVFDEKQVFDLLEFFDLDAKRNKKTNEITCKKKVV